MKVKFMPTGEEHDIEFNETILHLAQRCNLHIQSVCKGIPSCAECRIQIKEGEHHVLPPSKKELDLIGTAHYVDRSRLSCQLRCFGDVTVDLTEQIEKAKRTLERPQSRARKDGQTSKAVLGGILDNVIADDVEVSPDSTIVKERIAVEKFTGDPKLDNRDMFYGDFYKGEKKQQNNQRRHNNNRNNNNNQKNNGNQKNANNNPNSQQAAGANPEGGGKKRNRKRRNRNKNRGPAAAPGPSTES